MNYSFDSLESISFPDITNIWNKCWQGYTFDCTYTPEQMKVWLELSRVALPFSLVLKVGKRPVGLVLLAAEGTQGWLAGTAIAPEFRGHNLFAPLLREELEVAKHLGLERVRLEVLANNFAQRVYLAVGFYYLRPLYSYRLGGIPFVAKECSFPGSFRKVSLDEYFTFRLQNRFSPAWQRRESFLRRYSGLEAFLQENKHGGVLTSGAGKVLLDAWCVNNKQALSFLPQLAGQTLRNQPHDPLTNILHQIGVEPFATQHEMALDF